MTRHQKVLTANVSFRKVDIPGTLAARSVATLRVRDDSGWILRDLSQSVLAASSRGIAKTAIIAANLCPGEDGHGIRVL